MSRTAIDGSLKCMLGWHTAAGGSCSKIPFKLYMASVKVVDVDSWRQLSKLVHSQQQGERRQLPRLQLMVEGPCLGVGKHQHVRATA
jgi:hypothetical protein